MPTNNQIEDAFIKKEFHIHAEYLRDLFVESIQTKQLIKTQDLISVFASGDPFQISQLYTGTWMLKVKFPDHGRLIEIQQRKKRSGILSESDVRGIVYGIKPKKRKKKKNTQWYTRNVYGAQNRIIGRLMYGLSDIERERIIAALKKEEKV